ncbi:MAG: hypothetical protein QM535_08745 [Limnohabitans sp.]|nr:hypothetical protein [Limnohabitans sp.]
MEIILIIIIALFFLFLYAFYNYLKHTKNKSRVNERIIATCYLFTFILFIFACGLHSSPYYKAIDIVDDSCYTPFSYEHILTLLFYLITFVTSLFIIWKNESNLPPLTYVLVLLFTFIGIIINIVFIIQISEHNTSTLSEYYVDDGKNLFYLFPAFSIIIGTKSIINTIKVEADKSKERFFKNKFLNNLNLFLSTKYSAKTWSILLLFPVLFLCTLVLLLLGQDIDSLVKVFTETTTWRFSQKMHPPVLDHQGHYICTVAACGNPSLVKPIRLGKRNGQTIIVNRQLQIANAFEEMIYDFSPKLHAIIRKNYDKYGYNLSTKINTSEASNITYILMKPLEWIFLISLYLFCLNPEMKIKKQYKFKMDDFVIEVI